MKNLVNLLLILLTAIAFGCHKGSNNYSTTDHTVGMMSAHTWSGTSSGFVKGDTTMGGRDTIWALAFARVIADTVFPVQKINGFEVSVLGTELNYLSTDSITNKTVTFDSTLSGSATSILTYYYSRDSMTFEFHEVTGDNTSAHQYYQINSFFHTN